MHDETTWTWIIVELYLWKSKGPSSAWYLAVNTTTFTFKSNKKGWRSAPSCKLKSALVPPQPLAFTCKRVDHATRPLSSVTENNEGVNEGSAQFRERAVAGLQVQAHACVSTQVAVALDVVALMGCRYRPWLTFRVRAAGIFFLEEDAL